MACSGTVFGSADAAPSAASENDDDERLSRCQPPASTTNASFGRNSTTSLTVDPSRFLSVPSGVTDRFKVAGV
jgi:hypothetical protein